MYSHDTVGMGHMRRNMLLAESLASPPVEATILLAMGAWEGTVFAKPPGVDCLALPALRKDMNGHYDSRSLALTLEQLIAVRSGILEAAVRSFQPDVLIVDGVPRGTTGELDAALNYLRMSGRTRCVLGLRDVLDDPATVRRQWRKAKATDAIRDYYDAVWVYGDPRVYDLAAEYKFPADVAAKVSYTGYFDYRRRLHSGERRELPAPLLGSAERIALCVLGGGEDGDRLATAFARADFPPGMIGVVVMGPYFPAAARAWLRAQMKSNPSFKAIDFAPDIDLLLQAADRVVAMGGYNSVYEILGHGKHALIVPRVKPRCEQLIRARRLHDFGLVDVLHPDELSTEALSAWLDQDLGPPPLVRDQIDFNGLERCPQLLQELTHSFL
jgi:predicted glycosyltransferase